MVDTTSRDLDAQLSRLRHELSRTIEALTRTAAAGTELHRSLGELCRAVRQSVDQSRRLTLMARRERRVETIPPASMMSDPPRRVARGLPAYRLRRVMDYIDSSLAERIDVPALAAVAGMSSGHFTALFKRATGMSPHQAVMHRRFARARDLLADDSITIAEISCLVGFSSQAHFTTAFRKVHGTTPAAHRARYRYGRDGANQSWHSANSVKAKSPPPEFESHADEDAR